MSGAPKVHTVCSLSQHLHNLLQDCSPDEILGALHDAMVADIDNRPLQPESQPEDQPLPGVSQATVTATGPVPDPVEPAAKSSYPVFAGARHAGYPSTDGTPSPAGHL